MGTTMEDPRSSLEGETTTKTREQHMGDTNWDIFSWVSSQFADWAWNMAAIAAASSSWTLPLIVTYPETVEEQREMGVSKEKREPT